MTASRGEILVVDDERSMREFLVIFLTRAGYAVLRRSTTIAIT